MKPVYLIAVIVPEHITLPEAVKDLPDPSSEIRLIRTLRADIHLMTETWKYVKIQESQAYTTKGKLAGLAMDEKEYPLYSAAQRHIGRSRYPSVYTDKPIHLVKQIVK